MKIKIRLPKDASANMLERVSEAVENEAFFNAHLRGAEFVIERGTSDALRIDCKDSRAVRLLCDLLADLLG